MELTDDTLQHELTSLNPNPSSHDDASAKRANTSTHSDSQPKRLYPGEEMVATKFFQRDTKFHEGPSHAERLAPGPILDENISKALAHCLHISLRLLEHSTGRKALIETAKDIVSARREDAAKENKQEEGIYIGKSLDEMPFWVEKFLKQIREKAVPICVSKGIPGHYGYTQKWTWGSDMQDWDSATAAVVYLNEGMVHGLLRAADSIEECMRQQRTINATIVSQTMGINEQLELKHPEEMEKLSAIKEAQSNATVAFERSAFCISITLAHEFVHCFTGFLTGRAGPPTPQRVFAGPYGSDGRGEAGWQWCDRAFGGLIHFWYTRGKPAKSDQIGMPMLLEWNEDASGSFFFKINHIVIKRIVNLDFKGDDADSEWIKGIKNVTEPKVPHDEWRLRYRDVTAIWKDGRVVPDIDDQTQVPTSFSTDFAFAASLEAVERVITKPLQPQDLIPDNAT